MLVHIAGEPARCSKLTSDRRHGTIAHQLQFVSAYYAGRHTPYLGSERAMIPRSCQLVLTAIVIAWSSAAFAVCLEGHPSLEQEYQSSTTIFVGRVVSEEFTPESQNHLDGTTYPVEVEEVLHGSHAKTVKLFSENSSGRFPVRVGATYSCLRIRGVGSASSGQLRQFRRIV